MVAVMAAGPLYHVGGLLAGWLTNRRNRKTASMPPLHRDGGQACRHVLYLTIKITCVPAKRYNLHYMTRFGRVIIMSDYMTAGTCGRAAPEGGWWALVFGMFVEGCAAAGDNGNR